MATQGGSMTIVKNKTLRAAGLIWSLAAITIAVITGLLYLQWIGFGEQGEVQFSSVSWLVAQGHPLYTEVYAAERYSLQHGPVVYLIAGAIMKVLGPGYVTAKLSGVLALYLTIIISLIWFKKLSNLKTAFFLVGLEVWILFHWHHIYFIRPDSMMLLCMTVGMFAVTAAENRLMIILGSAVPLGLMINLKVHGVIYFIPVLALAFPLVKIRGLLKIGLIGIIIGSLPFLLPQISLHNYALWLFQSIEHGIYIKSLLAKVVMLSVLCLICLAVCNIYGINAHNFYRRNKLVILSLAAALIIPSVIGSKYGSGTNHLMPFIPVYMYILMRLSGDIRENGFAAASVSRKTLWQKLSCVFLVLVFIMVTLGGFNSIKRFIGLTVNDRRAVLQEIQQIEKLYPGMKLAVGYGEYEYYNYYRDFVPYTVFKGNPLLVEAVALTDMKGAGKTMPPSTIREIERGMVDVWLIPAGSKPFAMGIFDSEFQKAFIENYTLTSQMKYFDVWVYKHNK